MILQRGVEPTFCESNNPHCPLHHLHVLRYVSRVGDGVGLGVGVGIGVVLGQVAEA